MRAGSNHEHNLALQDHGDGPTRRGPPITHESSEALERLKA